ncbi:MAG TPA: TetR/AcrR family transcriptional regulator, partial [Dehalococcoidia bacterium]|nr:TetR/AcrR family transcriptional regulator [Dehalococcoidia bacterium]
MPRRYSMAQRAEGVRRTRLRIEMALMRLLGSRTYRSLTLADVAREAAVAGRTIQRHYGSKEEILAATIRYPEGAIAEQWAGIPPASSAAEAVRQLVKGAFSLYARHNVETWVAHSHAEDSPELRETLWNGIRSRLKRIEEMLERWASSLAVDRDEAKGLLVGMTSYLTYRAFTEFGGISPEEATDAVGAMLASRLVGQPRPQLRPHVFALFSGPREEEQLTASLVREGLERGDKVVLVTAPARRTE